MSDDLRIDIPIRVDTSRFDRDLQSVYAAIRRLERETVTINISADDTSLRGLQGQIDGLDATADVRVNAEERGFDEVQRRVDGFRGESATVDINADDSDLDAVEEKLNTIVGLAQISVGIELAGQGVDILTGLADTFGNISGVSGLFETNQALLELEATTGRIIPNARELIDNIYTQGWGESRTQIAAVIAEATKLGVAQGDLEEATTSALQVSLVTGQDVNEVLRSQANLVNTGLVPSFAAAGDGMVRAFQNGTDRADDLLETINEYGAPLADLGFSFEDLLAIFDTGLAKGARDTDVFADALLEFSIRLNEVGGTADTALATLGLEDLRQQWLDGEVDFDTFYNAVIDGLVAIDDPLLQATTTVELFGTKAEDIGQGTFLPTLDEARTRMVDFDGAASEAANTLSTSIPSALDRLQRVISTGIGNELDQAFDISGKIEDAQAGAEAFFAALDSGEGFGTAAGIGLQVAGLTELQDTLADFLIGFLQGIREVVAVLPGANTGGLDSLISTLGQGQLQLDIVGAANTDDLEEAVQQAIDRGVDPETVFGNLSEGLTQAIDAGDFSRALDIQEFITGAQELQGNLQTIDEDTRNALQGFENIANLGQINPFEGLSDAELSNIWEIPEEAVTRARELYDLGQSLEDIDVSGLVGENVGTDVISEIQTAISDAAGNLDFAGVFDIANALDPATLAQVFIDAAANGQTQITTALQPIIDDTLASLTVGEDQDLELGGQLAQSLQDLETQTTTSTDNVLTAIQTTQTEADSSLQLFGSSVDLAADTTMTATDNIRGAFNDTNVASDLLAGAGAEGAKNFGQSWALELDGTAISLAIFNSQVLDVVENLGALVQGGAALTGLSLGGGGSATVNNNNGGNTTNTSNTTVNNNVTIPIGF